MIRSVTVFASSQKVAAVYHTAAAELGRRIAMEGWTLVYGGNNVGTMDSLAAAARSAGGRVVGVTPKRLADKGIGDPACDELVVTADMSSRKAELAARGDAFVILPGGLGTLEELSEVLVGRCLGWHDKPIIVLDIDGYYRPLLEMIEHGVREGFIKASHQGAMEVATNVPDAIGRLRWLSADGPAQPPRAGSDPV